MLPSRNSQAQAVSLIGLCLLFLLTSLSAIGPQRDETARFSVDVALVLLVVSVQDDDGFVPGLDRSSFRVYDEGREREIIRFQEGDVPITAGIILDKSGSMKQKHSDVSLAALSFVRQRRPEDELFVVNFNDHAHLPMEGPEPFSSEPGRIIEALFATPLEGMTALYDGIRRGEEQIACGSHEKKALIVISDGGDNASSASLEEVLRRAQELPALIYTIGLYDPNNKEKDLEILRLLARETGGRSFFPDDTRKLRKISEQIANDLRRQYLIGFRATRAADGGFRRVRVEARDRRGEPLQVRSRSGYYSDGEAGRHPREDSLEDGPDRVGGR